MKKIVKLLTLSLIPLLICSCNRTNNSLENSEPTLSSNEVLSDNSEESKQTSSSNKYQIELGKKYTSTSWDNTINEMLEFVLEDKASKVPSFIAPSYDAVIHNKIIDEHHRELVCTINCYGVNSSSAEKLYSEKMVENDFLLSAGNKYGYLMKDYSSDVFLTYELVTGDTPCFTIETFVLQTRELTWNTDAVKLYTEMDVPSYEAPCYQTSYDASYDRLSVYALFVGKNAQTEYVNTLRTKGFSVTANDSTGAVQLVDRTGYLTVTVYQTYGDYNCDALYIAFSNAWPALGILEFTGIIGLPKLTSYTASYDGYTYIDPIGEGKEEDYTLCVYYVNASSTDYGNYITSLVNLGFTKGETETSESGIMSTYLTYVTDDKYQITLRMLYKISSSQICLVIYQAYQVQ